MIPYQTKIKKLSGTNYSELRKETYFIFNQIKKKTKRKPYIRSSYFDKQKIFFDYFWQHLLEKNLKERVKRLKYFDAAIEVIKIQEINLPSSKIRIKRLKPFIDSLD